VGQGFDPGAGLLPGVEPYEFRRHAVLFVKSGVALIVNLP
jgi:hypothetical protein